MERFEQLVKALRHCTDNEPSNGDCWNCPYQGEKCHTLLSDAAAAIEALQAEIRESMQKCAECGENEPKRGHWEPVPDHEGRPYKYVCSNCHRFHVNEDEWYGYCPNCGAVMGVPIMDGPIITPCRGCSDYDGYGGCKSKGGCARARMEVQE